MGFPPTWNNWIRQCITGIRYSLIINGTRSDWILAKRGFRQGCPLSPYLFILCSELLSSYIHQLDSRGIGFGMRFDRSSPYISHLLYADDILLFSRANIKNAKVITDMLNIYSSWTGQRLNAQKSRIHFSRNTPLYKQRRIATYFGFIRADHLTYLGVKLLGRHACKADFSNLIDDIKARLYSWGSRHLSFAGRLVLINSVIAAIPLYQMKNTFIPNGVLEDIETIIRSYLWSGNGARKMHFTPWSSVCTPKFAGGLGIHNLILWRNAFATRSSMAFANDGDSLWIKLIKARVSWADIDDINRRATSPIWKIVATGWNVLRRFARWNIYNGEKVDIAHDIWIDTCPISKLAIPINTNELSYWWGAEFSAQANLAARGLNPAHRGRRRTHLRWEPAGRLTMAAGRNSSIRIRRLILRSNNSWNSDFFIPWFGEWADNICNQIKINNVGSDILEWTPQVSNYNPEKYIYESHFEFDTNISWVWSLPNCPREKFFMWRIAKNAIPTYAWLASRHLSDVTRCPWGCNAVESIEHIICECIFTQKIRNCFANLGFILLSMPNLPDFFNYIQNIGIKDDLITHLQVSCVYHAWRNRNSKCHGEHYQTPDSIAICILNALQDSRFYSNRRTWDTIRPPGQPKLWYPPPVGWLKINFDASLLANQSASIGIIVRNHTGSLIKAYGKKILEASITDCEISAAASLEDILDDSIKEAEGIILEGDSFGACKFINANLHKKNLSLLCTSNFAFLLSFKNIIINHVKREFNRAADYCAKTARVSDFLFLPSHPLPSGLLAILESDYG